MRSSGINSGETARPSAAGELEAAIVALPVDDRASRSTRRSARRDRLRLHRASRLHEPMTIERLAAAPLVLGEASFGTEDPTRRQLAELAQRAG